MIERKSENGGLTVTAHICFTKNGLYTHYSKSVKNVGLLVLSWLKKGGLSVLPQYPAGLKKGVFSATHICTYMYNDHLCPSYAMEESPQGRMSILVA